MWILGRRGGRGWYVDIGEERGQRVVCGYGGEGAEGGVWILGRRGGREGGVWILGRRGGREGGVWILGRRGGRDMVSEEEDNKERCSTSGREERVGR